MHAARPNVACVGATTQRPAGELLQLRCPSVDLSAPGVNIVSTSINSAGGSPQYYYSRRTSMATAFVAGTLALMSRPHPPGAGHAQGRPAGQRRPARVAGGKVGEHRSAQRRRRRSGRLAGRQRRRRRARQQRQLHAGRQLDQADLDADGVGDACDDDRDGDGYPNGEDAFPDDPSEHADGDSDGVGDHADNCPSAPNPAQADQDGDGLGDACDDAPNGTGSTDTDDGGVNQTGGSRPTGS